MCYLSRRLAFVICLVIMTVGGENLAAQGLETYPDLYLSSSDGGLPDILPTADNSLFYTMGNTVGLLSSEGEVVWRRIFDLEVDYAGIDTIQGRFWLASFRHTGGEIYLDEVEIDYNGVPSNARSTLVDTLAAERELGVRDAVIHRKADGGLVGYYSADGPGYIPLDRNWAFAGIIEIDAARNVTRRERIEFGDFIEVINGNYAANGKHLLIVRSDTIADGQYSRDADVQLALQVNTDGSFDKLANINTGGNKTSIARTGPNNFAIPDEAEITPQFTFPLIIRYFNLESGREEAPLLLDEDPGGNANAPLTATQSQDGGLLYLHRDSYFPAGDKQYTRLRKISRDREEVFTEAIEIPSVDNVPWAVGQYTNEELYVFTIAVFPDPKLQFLRTDSLGRTFPQEIQGNLRQAELGDCNWEETMLGLNNTWLQIRPTQAGKDTTYAYTGNDGFFRTRLDTGQYELKVIRRNAYWETCPSLPFRVEAEVDTTILFPTLQRAYDCALVSTAIIGQGNLRRCDENFFQASYLNQGTLPSAPSLIRITLDSHLVATSSFPAWDQRVGDTLFYNIDELAVGEAGTINIRAELACEETFKGQTHCTEIHAFPDSLCTPPNVNWDGSSVEVSGNCAGDSVIFRITNESVNDMLAPSQYIIVEDLVLHFGGEFQLNAGESLSIPVPANGATYRIEANQPVGHPGSSRPSATVEGCGANEDEEIITGIFGQYPQDDGDPFVAIFCAQNDGAEPDGLLPSGAENSKVLHDEPLVARVFPYGIGSDHLIDSGTVLRYHLEFENQTDELITRMTIEDTLSPRVQIPSVRVLGGSHSF